MNIIGPDTLVFAVPDIDGATRFLIEYGLVPDLAVANRFEALDGTAIAIVAMDDPEYPNTMGTENQLRLMVYGVRDQDALDRLSADLRKDMQIRDNADGSFDVVDTLGFRYRFQISMRKESPIGAELMNLSGAAPQRPVNTLGVDKDFVPQPRSLSHFSLFVPDLATAEAFHTRLGFAVTDRLGGNPFMRTDATDEHHTLFLIQTPPHMQGAEHLAFHLGGPGEVLRAGSRFVDLGHESVWGPGRHVMGSNWFWYFRSPLGINIEYDADMDKVDDNWAPRELDFHPDNAQVFMFEKQDNRLPFGGPPGGSH